MHFSASLLSLIRERKNDAAKSLIQGSNLHAEVDADGSTLLHHAAEHGNLELTRYLLDKGCSINAVNTEKVTPLLLSVKGRHRAVARFLLKSGAHICAAIHQAALAKDARSVRMFLRRGADVNATDSRGFTPLAYLYVENDKERECEEIEIVTMMLEAGASLTKLLPRGHLAIQLTLSKGSCEAVRLVLQSTVDFGVRCNFGERTLLHLLAMNGNPGIVDAVRPHIERFDVDAVDRWGGTPLHDAIVRTNVRMTEFLLGRGAKANVRHRRSRLTTLLCVFIGSSTGTQEQYNQCVELLLQHGADAQATMTNQYGEQVTVVDAALRSNHLEGLKYVVAQMAIREEQGVPITELISSKLEAQREFKGYLRRCRRLLRKEVAGTVTVFKLLTADEKIMAKYLNTEELALKLIRISRKPKLKSYYAYFYNTLKKNFIKGVTHKTLKDAAAVVITRLVKYRFDKSNVIIENIIGYLTNKDLSTLYQMYE